MTIRNLEHLFHPASIAVIGASMRPGRVGTTVLRNLRQGGFAGAIHAVNPRHEVVDGLPCHARVGDLPMAPELAVICTPPSTVPGLIAELASAGCKAAIVLTAGLDAATRQAMLEAARPGLLRVLGPNCVGLLVPGIGLNASFAHASAQAGKLAFVSQSGALATAVLDWANARGIGFPISSRSATVPTSTWVTSSTTSPRMPPPAPSCCTWRQFAAAASSCRQPAPRRATSR